MRSCAQSSAWVVSWPGRAPPTTLLKVSSRSNYEYVSLAHFRPWSFSRTHAYPTHIRPRCAITLAKSMGFQEKAVWQQMFTLAQTMHPTAKLFFWDWSINAVRCDSKIEYWGNWRQYLINVLYHVQTACVAQVLCKWGTIHACHEMCTISILSILWVYVRLLLSTLLWSRQFLTIARLWSRLLWQDVSGMRDWTVGFQSCAEYCCEGFIFDSSEVDSSNLPVWFWA
jgi:hypothetical protein